MKTKCTPQQAAELASRTWGIVSVAAEVHGIILSRYYANSELAKTAKKISFKSLDVSEQAIEISLALPVPPPAEPSTPAENSGLGFAPMPVAPAKKRTDRKLPLTLDEHRALAERVRLLKQETLQLCISARNTAFPCKTQIVADSLKIYDLMRTLASMLDDKWCLARFTPGTPNIPDYPYYGPVNESDRQYKSGLPQAPPQKRPLDNDFPW